ERVFDVALGDAALPPKLFEDAFESIAERVEHNQMLGKQVEECARNYRTLVKCSKPQRLGQRPTSVNCGRRQSKMTLAPESPRCRAGRGWFPLLARVTVFLRRNH